MSSRGQFVGSGPDSGIYQPAPVPSTLEDLPPFLSDEFLKIAGLINGILEGGAFPPQSELPKRVFNGRMVYFTKAITPDITNAGLWIYLDGWKLVVAL